MCVMYYIIITSPIAVGLSHLVGTNMLRAYMHGYFMDIQLYRKAREGEGRGGQGRGGEGRAGQGRVGQGRVG